jgi:hypothetical protein
MGLGISLTFAVLTALATIAMVGSSYLAFLNDDAGMQVVSGISFGAAVAAACVSVAAFHLFAE